MIFQIIDGFSYEQAAILEWFERGNRTSPMTNQEVSTESIVANDELKKLIDEYLASLDFDKFDVTPDLLS